MYLFFLLYLLHSITLAIRLVAYANFKTQKKRAESSRLSSRPSRLHEKMQKGIEKSPTEIKRFVIFFFQSDWDHVTPKRTCQHAITSVFPPTLHPPSDIRVCSNQLRLQSSVLVQAKASDFEGVSEQWSLPSHAQTQTPTQETSVLARPSSPPPKPESVHIKTQHLKQPPVVVCRFCKAARVAVSNTSQIPSLVLAEHSK